MVMVVVVMVVMMGMVMMVMMGMVVMMVVMMVVVMVMVMVVMVMMVMMGMVMMVMMGMVVMMTALHAYHVSVLRLTRLRCPEDSGLTQSEAPGSGQGKAAAGLALESCPCSVLMQYSSHCTPKDVDF